MVLAFVISVALCGAPKVDPKLVGTWLAGNALGKKYSRCN